MPLDPQTKSKLHEMIHADDVVLFMKGSRHFPQCGFSATVVQILDKLVPKYATVNVLSDPAIREGIKEYSQWPTIPQLYVKGELLGGCDIVREMFASGELQKRLGVETAPAAAPAKAPRIAVSAAAAQAFADAAGEAGDDVLRLEIDPRFQNELYFGPKRAGDLEVKVGSLVFFVDPETARRADGVSIDFVETQGGVGFKITNPNEASHGGRVGRVKPLTATELAAMRKSGQKVELFDVRPEAERALAKIDWARPYDGDGEAYLASLPKDAAIVFQCHHGMRSQRAAEEVVREGYTNVYNLEGGIEAWSQAVDPSVPRY